MLRLHSPKEWISRFGGAREGTVLTIGNFDGMHRGHQEILRRVIDQARQSHMVPAVLTFFPHPVRVLRPDEAPLLLMTLDQKLAAFEAAGIEAVLVLSFDETLSKLSAEDFVGKYLVETLRTREVLVGENFRFGHRQQGDVTTLEELGSRLGFEVKVVNSLSVESMVVSSSAVRKAVRDGRMEESAQLLAKPFTLAGVIQTGSGQGRKLVVPTLNLKTEQELLPKTGVYITRTATSEGAYRSVTNVGMRPTFNGAHLTIESHLFGFAKDLTAGKLEIEFLTRLRDERKFANVVALREQVLKDIEEAKKYHERNFS
jgi:riboflavin kinase / FMN adenylyltransferase